MLRLDPVFERNRCDLEDGGAESELTALKQHVVSHPTLFALRLRRRM